MGWISPNAHCPVCGASVYFYANEHGSRVFFDELGPPWPKHPCTDNGTAHVTAAGGRQTPSRHDFRLAQNPGHLRDPRWKSYAVKRVTVEGGYSRIALQALNGSGIGPTWTVSERVSLRADDLVFVRAQQMSYFDTAVGEPVVVQDDKRAAWLAGKVITERDRQHILAMLDARVAAGEVTPEEMAAVTTAVVTARNRGDVADAFEIKVADLKVAPPRFGDLLLLAIAFILMIVATIFANDARSVQMMLPGLPLLMATAVYRLNPGMRRGPRILFAVTASLVAICPAGFIGGAIQVVLLNR
ncbi:hypothetical protein [Verrucosispora sp. FIM060022]|uniref:hypothetical protein n=1 Tax=Verrucosispora sp. FIM060022 TaxID=1479020 RepID=UPI000F86553C|nr:hypothetical protein [Verrucosispora sp. FIM060022]RUL95185.1 hypothetical protein EG812_05985 [Verrucosispora sp. FIM060022]